MKGYSADDVKKAIMQWPGRYETEKGFKFMGAPVSEIAKMLRDDRWRGVGRVDQYDLKRLGLKIVTARYIGGARPKRFCPVVFARLQWDFRKGVIRK